MTPRIPRTWVSTKYDACHARVRRARGNPDRCSKCGATDEAKRYEWANLTGNYADPQDYDPMCKSCHVQFDISRGSAIGKRGLGKKTLAKLSS